MFAKLLLLNFKGLARSCALLSVNGKLNVTITSNAIPKKENENKYCYHYYQHQSEPKNATTTASIFYYIMCTCAYVA
jgi:hypothetical protein